MTAKLATISHLMAFEGVYKFFLLWADTFSVEFQSYMLGRSPTKPTWMAIFDSAHIHSFYLLQLSSHPLEQPQIVKNLQAAVQALQNRTSSTPVKPVKIPKGDRRRNDLPSPTGKWARNLTDSDKKAFATFMEKVKRNPRYKNTADRPCFAKWHFGNCEVADCRFSHALSKGDSLD